MITAIVYLIDTLIVGVFAYKCYSIGYAKGLKNSFANYLFLSSLFISISFFKSAIMIPIAYYTDNPDILFWADFIGRALFYTAAVFAVQIPLYKYYPNNKWRFVFSFIAAVLGIALLIYQFFFRNYPTFQPTGIIDWNSNLALVIGMGYLLALPWIATSYIFIREFVVNRFQSPKPFLLGSGFLFIVFGGLFQDAFSSAILFILFSIIIATGYLMILAGLFYEE